MTPLHSIGEFIREMLLQIPLGAVRVLFLAVPILLLIWIWRLPAEAVSKTVESGKTLNLRPWAMLALFVQVMIYVWL